MFVTKSKTKTATTYYLSKTFRDKETNKTSSKIIERIGTKEEIQKKIGKSKTLMNGQKNMLKEKRRKMIKNKHQFRFHLIQI